MPNAYINKVQLSDGTTLIDLTSDTITAGDAVVGVTLHLASGEAVTGTLNDFTGATSSAAGTHGLVPAPASGEQNKLLFGDGDWSTLEIGSQMLGDSIIVTFYRGSIGPQKIINSFPIAAVTSRYPGLMSVDDKAKLDGIDAGANAYTLPTASADTKGGVKVGAGLTMTGEVLSADEYALPTASASTKGGVKIGSGLTMTGEVLSADGYTLPTASTNTKGGVKVGAGLAINDAVLSADIPTATQSAAGLMSAADKTALDRIGRTVLWENADSTSSFAAQSVTLSGSAANYDFLLFEFTFSTTGQQIQTQLVSADFTGDIALRIVQAGSNRTGGRNCTVSGTTVTFEAASFNGSTSNTSCIPYRIIGIKL